jgi:hypothetical protein
LLLPRRHARTHRIINRGGRSGHGRCRRSVTMAAWQNDYDHRGRIRLRRTSLRPERGLWPAARPPTLLTSYPTTAIRPQTLRSLRSKRLRWQRDGKTHCLGPTPPWTPATTAARQSGDKTRRQSGPPPKNPTTPVRGKLRCQKNR